MNKLELQEQLDDLCEILGCRLDQLSINTAGMMYVEFGYVEGPILSDDYTHRYPNLSTRYMTNMHELGHYALGHTQGRPPKENEKFYFDNGVLRSEAEAWQWAMDNAIIKNDPILSSFMWDTCMGSYYRAAIGAGFGNPGQRLENGNRHHVSFAYDATDDFFWTIRERMLDGVPRTKSQISVRGICSAG